MRLGYRCVLPLLILTSFVNSVASFVLPLTVSSPSTARASARNRPTRCRMTTQPNNDGTKLMSGPEPPAIPPNSKRLFLVRHGEAINPGRDGPVYYGSMDVALSPLGQEEAKAAAQYLSQFDLKRVFASPLSRAIYGAKQVQLLQQHETDLTVLEGFKELDRGSWCGKTKDEIGLEAISKFDACDESATPDGGESFPFLKRRVLKARDEALSQISAGCAAAVVSHLQVTRSMLSDAKDIPTSEMTKLPIATASITCIDYDTENGSQTVHFESFKPKLGLKTSNDKAN